MFKPGTLVRLNPKYAVRSEKELVGLVLNAEKAFYQAATIFHAPQDRYHILWGNNTYTYEPTNALIEVQVDD